MSKIITKNLITIIYSLRLHLLRESQLKALAHICPRLAEQIDYSEKYINESIYNIIENNSINMFESILGGLFGEIPGHFSKNIVPVLTDEGLCFSFNALNSHEIYTDS